MSINLDDYKELLEDLEPESVELLKHAWPEVVKTFSSRGLDNYLKGASAIRGLGRGRSLVDCWIDEIPLVAKEIGEDIISDLATTALSLASRTSGAVIELVLATSPTAAKRLGDAQLFQNYLQFLNILIAQAPRGMRPMLNKLDILFGQLTLGGLRRWAMWGAHAHRTNYEEQIKYFGLESKESLAVLQKERKGTLFVDVQRRINMYLRALWARDFFMKPTSGDFETREGYKPYLENYFIYLPDAYDSHAGVTATEVYRAAAAHAAAHLVETKQPISAEGLSPMQMAVISVIEDARVEALAIRRFPGLRKTWAALHTATPDRAVTMGDYLNRLARALLDPDYQDNDRWIAEGRQLFAAAEDKLDTYQISWDIGVQLTHSFREKNIPFAMLTDQLTAPYRDDNRYFWEFEEFDLNKSLSAGYEAPKQVRKYVNVMEFANEVEVETAGDDAQEIWVMGTEFFPYEDTGVSYNDLEGKEPVSAPYHYSEWDYQIQLERPDWATVQEKRAKLGDMQCID